MRLRQPAFRPGLVVPERREALPAVGVPGLPPVHVQSEAESWVPGPEHT